MRKLKQTDGSGRQHSQQDTRLPLINQDFIEQHGSKLFNLLRL